MRYPFRPLSVAVAAAVLFAAVGARAATFTVTTLADSGAGSLRQAIADANAAAGADEIVFAGGLVGSVELASALPTVSESLTLTGPGPEALRIDANQHHQVLTLWGVPGNVFAISGVTLTGGLASEEGGGVFLAEQQTLTLEDVHLVDNAARDGELRFWGGGLFASSGTVVTIRRTLVAGNEGSVGGGIYMGGTSLLVEQSAIVRNRAIFEGGGLWLGPCDATVTETTVAQNVADTGTTATSLGGGVLVGNGATLTMYQATVAGNRALDGPGIRLFGTGDVDQIGATIVAGNRYLGTGNEGNCFPPLGVADLHNLSGDASCGFTGASDLEGVDPELHSLAPAGGPTPSLAPMPGSPAIDAGAAPLCISIDQRGWARPVDGDAVPGAVCDLGATEYQGAGETLISARDFEWPDPLSRWSVAATGL